MSRNVVGKSYHNHERVGPCPVEAPSVEGIVPRGKGEAALLVRQGKVQRIRNRFQLSALAELVEVAIVSQERFEDARFILRTWIDTQLQPLGELKADNPAQPPEEVALLLTLVLSLLYLFSKTLAHFLQVQMASTQT